MSPEVAIIVPFCLILNIFPVAPEPLTGVYGKEILPCLSPKSNLDVILPAAVLVWIGIANSDVAPDVIFPL